MPIYIYKARDAAGKPLKGTMEAANKETVIDKLRGAGYITTRITETSSKNITESLLYRLRRIRTDEMILFYVKLSNLIGAGINILTSLYILSTQVGNKKLKDILNKVSLDVEEGKSLSEALERSPGAFSRLFINMVKTGEASGNLDNVLKKFANFAERQAALWRKIKGALFYPIILVIGSGVISVFLVMFVMPRLAEMFASADIKLPVITLIFYKIGIVGIRIWYSVLLLIIAIVFVITYYVNTKTGRLNFDRLKMNLPLIGVVYRNILITRFSDTLGTLVETGVPLLESLDITKEIVGNEILIGKITEIRRDVEKGGSIANAMKRTGEFPSDMVEMIAVGEETGQLPEILGKISNFYDMYIEYAIRQLTTVIEPLFVILLGGLVGLIMAAMLIPVFEMTRIVGGG